MAKVTTELIDPTVTIEHWIHRLENGSYTYTTRTAYTSTETIEEAVIQAADLATKADDLARQELIRRLSKDVQTYSNPEVIELWGAVKETRARLGQRQR